MTSATVGRGDIPTPNQVDGAGEAGLETSILSHVVLSTAGLPKTSRAMMAAPAGT
jgi:hypothetical protein